MLIETSQKPSLTKRRYEQKEQPIPKYHCRTCQKFSNMRCDCFQRRVEPDYNRCFNHSWYRPAIINFKVASNLEEIMKREEEQEKLRNAC